MLTRTVTVLSSTFRALLKQPPPMPILRQANIHHTPHTTHASELVPRLISRHIIPAARSIIKSYVKYTPVNSSRRAISSGATNLSLPTRVALQSSSRNAAHTRPFHAPFQPRAPTLPIPRSTATTIGLGTARNFSSARPLFQNLVQNVPVAARAFCELDLDPRLAQLRANTKIMRKSTSGAENLKGRSLVLGPNMVTGVPPFQLPCPIEKEESNDFDNSVATKPTKGRIAGGTQSYRPKVARSISLFEGESIIAADELDYYLPAASQSIQSQSGQENIPSDPFITYLSIPLVPPMHSSTREPLPRPSEGRLFDMVHDEMWSPTWSLADVPSYPSLHGSYQIHSQRIDALFALLAYADVWNSGASCERLGLGSFERLDIPAEFTRALEIKFEGWSKERVQDLLAPAHDPHSGEEWYNIRSVPRKIARDGMTEMGEEAVVVDMGMSFVMPTLDFSHSFQDAVNGQIHHTPYLHQTLEQPVVVDSALATPTSSVHVRGNDVSVPDASTDMSYEWESDWDLDDERPDAEFIGEATESVISSRASHTAY